MSSHLEIAIIGAGPSGLTLGLLLHKHDIPFTIFEGREKPTEEELAEPSGSLDLHEETGVAAVRGCGLYDEFIASTGDCTEAQILSDKHGNVLYSDMGGARERPEISRHKLIQLLLSHLPSSTIKWGHKVISAESTTLSGHPVTELDFGEHGKQTFDLTIGADGAWSKIRNLLTDIKPQYSGTQNITFNIRHITKRYPHLAKLVGSGTYTSLGDGHGVFSQRSVQDSARIYIFMTIADEHYATKSGLSDKSAAEAKDQLLGGDLPFHKWNTNIRELIAVACDDESANNPCTKLDIKPLYILPVGYSRQPKPGITIIGDAAHLMCPWAGEGVNLALRDSLDLSHAIAKAYEIGGPDKEDVREALNPLIKEFEASMVARAKIEAEGTVENGEMMFGSDDAARNMADWFKSIVPPNLDG